MDEDVDYCCRLHMTMPVFILLPTRKRRFFSFFSTYYVLEKLAKKESIVLVNKKLKTQKNDTNERPAVRLRDG